MVSGWICCNLYYASTMIVVLPRVDTLVLLKASFEYTQPGGGKGAWYTLYAHCHDIPRLKTSLL